MFDTIFNISVKFVRLNYLVAPLLLLWNYMFDTALVTASDHV